MFIDNEAVFIKRAGASYRRDITRRMYITRTRLYVVYLRYNGTIRVCTAYNNFAGKFFAQDKGSKRQSSCQRART